MSLMNDGSGWESNPPGAALQRLNGFEDRGAHQEPGRSQEKSRKVKITVLHGGRGRASLLTLKQDRRMLRVRSWLWDLARRSGVPRARLFVPAPLGAPFCR